MSGSPESGPLPSSLGRRLRQLRGDLVLQLFMRRGPFWEAVRDVRDRWRISAEVRLPPSVVGWLLPEDAPDPEDSKKYWEYAHRWLDEMSALRARAVPDPRPSASEIFDRRLEESWKDFLAACVLYDPPDDQLVDFASYREPDPTFLSDSAIPPKVTSAGIAEMVGPPVKTLWDLTELRDWYWLRVIDHLSELYLKPQGVDVEDLVEHAAWDVPGFLQEYQERYRQYSQRYYVEVDEYTSLEDVKGAFRMIRSIQPAKENKPPRDRLISVQCAILYDRHNRADPEDRRRRRWTYAKLAEAFGLSSGRAAKDHVSLGRKLLGREDLQEVR